MAAEDINVPITLPPGTGISFSQCLFSEEVAMAAVMDGQALDTRDITYEFSNGRRFLSTP